MLAFILLSLSIVLSGEAKQAIQSNQSLLAVLDVQYPKKPSKNIGKKLEKDPIKLPVCIKNKIDSFKLKEPHERPVRVLEYVYKGKKVYYVIMPCCDFFNEVYDNTCKYLGAPEGGFSGKGDGKIPDFLDQAKNERLVWGSPK